MKARRTPVRPFSKAQSGFTLIELLVVIAIIAILAAILFPVFARARDKARAAACMSNARQVGMAALQYTQDYDETWVMYSYGVPGYSVGFGNSWGLRYWTLNLYPYTKNKDVYNCPTADGTNMTYGLWENYPTAPTPSNDSASCVGCDRVGWTWNSFEEAGFTKYPAVDPAFQPAGKRGFKGETGDWWSGSSLPEADIQDPAGAIWLAEGNWPDLGNDSENDYGWVLANPNNPGRPFRGGKVRGRHQDGFIAIFGDGHVKWIKFGSSKPRMWTIQAD